MARRNNEQSFSVLNVGIQSHKMLPKRKRRTRRAQTPASKLVCYYTSTNGSRPRPARASLYWEEITNCQALWASSQAYVTQLAKVALLAA